LPKAKTQLKRKWCSTTKPLSFVDVPVQAYIEGLLGVYALQRTELLASVFVWAYERKQYAVIDTSRDGRFSAFVRRQCGAVPA
jgi:hypothetical protein